MSPFNYSKIINENQNYIYMRTKGPGPAVICQQSKEELLIALLICCRSSFRRLWNCKSSWEMELKCCTWGKRI